MASTEESLKRQCLVGATDIIFKMATLEQYWVGKSNPLGRHLMDGDGRDAGFDHIGHICWDAKRSCLWIADVHNHCIRQCFVHGFRVLRDHLVQTLRFMSVDAIIIIVQYLVTNDRAGYVVSATGMDLVGDNDGKEANDGEARTAKFNKPLCLVLAPDVLYISEIGVPRIRAFDLITRMVTTVAGIGVEEADRKQVDGDKENARFHSISGLGVDVDGLFCWDQLFLRRVTFGGNVSPMPFSPFWKDKGTVIGIVRGLWFFRSNETCNIYEPLTQKLVGCLACPNHWNSVACDEPTGDIYVSDHDGVHCFSPNGDPNNPVTVYKGTMNRHRMQLLLTRVQLYCLALDPIGRFLFIGDYGMGTIHRITLSWPKAWSG